MMATQRYGEPLDKRCKMPSDTVTDYEWFKQKLEEKNLSQTRLGKLMGLDKSSISLLLHGQRRMTIDYAADIARLLGTSVTEVMERAGARMEGISAAGPINGVPLSGWVDDQGAIHPDKARGMPFSVPDTPPGSTAVQWRTTHTRMELFDRWIVVAGPKQQPDPNAMHDRFCIVNTTDGRTLLRSVRRGYTTGAYTLMSIGDEPAIDTGINWYRPVLMLLPA